ncbi:DUF1573 domain-containing protein [Candidatus Daviesbacteria bacterium]|nr:DUF1573 domain-containing protein [Candidatus Daviesbacteria bacterium]
MTEKKLIIAFIIGTVLILGGGVMVLNSSTPKKITSSQSVKVETGERKFDWGQINYNGPKATKIFKIKNTGTDVLKLTSVKTSCSCTSAQLVIDDQRSPLFSMHSVSSWVGEVKPGKEALLEVVFDQAFHGPSGVGPVERIISVETNDAQNPYLEFNLKGVVVNEKNKI